MIHYIIAAGIGAFLGSQSKKSKKSYAHGGEIVGYEKYVKEGLLYHYEDNMDFYEAEEQAEDFVLDQADFIKSEFEKGTTVNDTVALIISKYDWEDEDEDEDYAKGGQTTPPITNYHKNIMGTLSFDLKVKGMRKPQDFIVYPIREKTDTISIQSDKKFGEINILTGRGILSKSGSAMYHLSLDKARSNVNEFQLSKGEVQELKTQIKSTTGKSVGGSFVKSDNSAADLLAKGGEVKFRKLAKSKNFDIVTPDGRFEIEVGAFGMPKSIIIDGHRRDINRNPLAIKYRTEIQEYLDKN